MNTNTAATISTTILTLRTRIATLRAELASTNPDHGPGTPWRTSRMKQLARDERELAHYEAMAAADVP